MYAGCDAIFEFHVVKPSSAWYHCSCSTVPDRLQAYKELELGLAGVQTAIKANLDANHVHELSRP